jgi:hypothetical protein
MIISYKPRHAINPFYTCKAVYLPTDHIQSESTECVAERQIPFTHQARQLKHSYFPGMLFKLPSQREKQTVFAKRAGLVELHFPNYIHFQLHTTCKLQEKNTFLTIWLNSCWRMWEQHTPSNKKITCIMNKPIRNPLTSNTANTRQLHMHSLLTKSSELMLTQTTLCFHQKKSTDSDKNRIIGKKVIIRH